jgi:hypothetical protein
LKETLNKTAILTECVKTDPEYAQIRAHKTGPSKLGYQNWAIKAGPSKLGIANRVADTIAKNDRQKRKSHGFNTRPNKLGPLQRILTWDSVSLTAFFYEPK